MEKVIINDIEFQYNKNQENEVKHIKTILDKNRSLFSKIISENSMVSLIPTNNPQIFYIEDFDLFFSNTIKETLEHPDMKNALDDKNVLMAMYIELLIRQNFNNVQTIIQATPNIDDETIMFIISYKYYEENGSIDDFIENLKFHLDDEKIFEWLKNKERFNTYNYLLEMTVNFLKDFDIDFFNNINEVIDKIYRDVMSVLAQSKVSNENLPKISIDKMDKLFNDFLIYIDAPDSWKEMYQTLKNNHYIVYEDAKDEVDASACYKDNDGILKIKITTDGTISCFSSLVHEFIHYVSWSENNLQFSLIEFPSIFFEKIAADFLKQSGYSGEIITYVVNKRKKNNLDIIVGLNGLFSDIAHYSNNNKIKREDKIALLKGQCAILYQTKEKMAKIFEENNIEIEPHFLERQAIDFEKVVDDECDSLINCYIQNGLLVLNGYQYLMGSVLTDEIYNKIDISNDVFLKMIRLTQNLSELNLNNILEEFEINNLFYAKKGKIKIKA